MEGKNTEEKEIIMKQEAQISEEVSEKKAEDIKEQIKENTEVEIVQENAEKNKDVNNPQESKTSKIFSIFGRILTYSIVIFLLIILVRALVYKKYDVFGYRFYIIMSGSMEPTIHVSDGIITKETNDLKDGDIIAFNNQGGITVHRIIKTYTQENGDKLFQTKGDNNNGADRGLVEKSQIKGKVICRVPKVGNAILFLQRNIIIILILIIGVAIIIYLVRRLI